MGQGQAKVGGGVTLAEEQDLASVVAGEAALGGGQTSEEAGAVDAHVGEGLLDLGEVGAATIPRWMDELRVDVHASTAWSELVARNESKVSGIDEELVLGDADGQDLGDVVVRDGIAIAVDSHEAVDAADAIEDAGAVVGVEGQGPQKRLLLGKHLQFGEPGLLVRSGIAGGPLPLSELPAQVLDIAEAPAVEEAPFEFPITTLHPRLVVWVARAAGHWPKLIVSGKGEKAWVVDGLTTLPAQHDRPLTVVLACLGGTLEASEGSEVAIHEGMEVAAGKDAVALAGGVGEHVGEELDELTATPGEINGEG